MKKTLIRIILGAIFFACGLIIPSDLPWVSPVIFILGYLIVGGDVVLNALQNILHGKVFDENFLMSVATIGAFIIGEFPEAMAVMLFFQVGELFQSYAVNNSRKSISDLMDIRPDYANRKDGDVLTKVDPEEIQIGELILVQIGEKIPLDGIVLEGTSTIDTSALTGESIPRKILPHDEILSGCINMTGVLTIKVTKPFSESTVSKILELVENASDNKSRSENFITKFAAVYTPIVVIAALLLALVPPLIFPGETFSDWTYRALTFLVVSCPCALVISVPLSFFGGIGGASKAGILIKGSNYMETLSKARTVVFDKTGTLTQGSFNVQEISPVGISKEDLLRYAAYVESYSPHPISVSLKRAFGAPIDQALVSKVEDLAGHGLSGIVEGHPVLAGNRKLMGLHGITLPEAQPEGTIVHVAVDNQYAGYILIADQTASLR
ncbi:MAG: cadmium family heavy metal-translocating P-type ATPase [Anaerovoracaceae bacterium]